MPTRMSELKIKELSGVDGPANELPGWIVAKSAEWKDEVREFEKQICGTYDGLTSEAADLYFGKAPEDVEKARHTLAEYMAKDMEVNVPETEDGETDGETEVKPEPTRKSIAKRIQEVFTGPEIEKSDSDPDPDPDPEPSVEKSEADDETEAKVKKDAETEDAEKDADAEAENEDKAPETPAPVIPTVDEIAEAVTKSLGEVIADQVSDQLVDQIADQVEPMREAMSNALDRIESVESYLSGSNALDGQEIPTDGEDEPSGISKAIGVAMRNGRVELN